MTSRGDLIERLVTQLAGVFKGHDPLAPKTRDDLMDAARRVRLLTNEWASRPAAWPDAPRTPTVSEGDGERILERVLEGLKVS